MPRRLTDIADAVLDRTVVLGYSAPGYRLRRRAWSAAGLPRMDGRVVAVTGATSGIGRAAAEGFAGLGASLRLLVRSRERGEQARAEIARRAGHGDVRVLECDLARLDSVRRCAEELAATERRLDVLVNNAGVLSDRRTTSPDGFELTFATNVLGPFVLTGLLVPVLERLAPASRPARIVNVSSGGMYTHRLPAADLQFEHGGYEGAAAYARTKRMQVVLTEQWARRLPENEIVVHAMHPGWVDTPGLQQSLPGFAQRTRRLLRTPEEGADTIVWLGAAPEPAAVSGRFWHDRRPRPTHLRPGTRERPEDREHLWQELARLSGYGP